ncbi:MAG: hypothetical protein NVS1B4_16170 [Gemmatimonadaceae bacterium]
MRDSGVASGDGERVRAIVAGHGDFAAGMVSAVSQIAGCAEMFVPLSNRGLAPAALEARLRDELAQPGTRLIFTDLPAGSWTIAARRVLRGRADVTLVAGANLAALLDFSCRSNPGAPDAARHALEKGRAAMLLVEGTHAG